MGKGNSGGSRAAANNHSNQCNPNNAAYHSSRGGSSGSGSGQVGASANSAQDNRANQLNPNNPAYQSSRKNENPSSGGGWGSGALGIARPTGQTPKEAQRQSAHQRDYGEKNVERFGKVFEPMEKGAQNIKESAKKAGEFAKEHKKAIFAAGALGVAGYLWGKRK